jgi:hypothetical protein
VPSVHFPPAQEQSLRTISSSKQGPLQNNEFSCPKELELNRFSQRDDDPFPTMMFLYAQGFLFNCFSFSNSC